MGSVKVRKVCSKCGSNDVLAEAYVYWNDEGQRWEIGNVSDQFSICGSEQCQGSETTIVDEEIGNGFV